MSISDHDWQAIRDIYEDVGIPSDYFLGYPKILLHFMALLKKKTGREFHAEAVCSRLLSERKSGHLPKAGDPEIPGVLKKFMAVKEEVAGSKLRCPMCDSEVTLRLSARQ